MARLLLEDAVLMTGRSPETIERWIASGKVDAERAGNAWLVDMRSLLNVAATEEATTNGNGHAHSMPSSPIDQTPDEFGGRRDAVREVYASQPVTSPRPAPAAPPSPPEPPTAVDTSEPPPNEPGLPDQPPGMSLAIERSAAAYTVDVATTAIGALNSRLEQAMSEIERLQDERLKLALQLGYAQSQLKTAQEQLKMLTAPPAPGPFRRFVDRLFRRGGSQD